MSSQVPIVNLRLLNSGGYGEVFIGQRSDNGQEVIVKYLRDAHLPHNRKAFFREVKILARRVSGLVPLLGWNMKAVRPWYVMPYVAGGPLTQYAGLLNERQLQHIAKELAGTLARLHALYIVHGDVKPDNVLVSRGGPLVADPLGSGFGCTALFSENHGGTPGYCAPEIRQGGAISYAGDVYSFGATLYHLATGQRPQDGMRLDHVFSAKQSRSLIEEIVIACCQPDASSRPTMSEVVRILAGESWESIASRRKAEELVKVVGVVGGLLLLGRMLSD